ncbi:hypothetical protein CDL15_Pgr010741 [Punica granatum]|uniref:DUF4220 domain-containing protein n=1 Tax=Punica granatum TaxID=22663 RepID=A0A218W5I8_PUNGR|nr:hypothetical protein CDL15_Pgr010741 [Punica granatum]PKI58197.1 hypothetical protein CRG98_021419 [Punica granatum]
MAYDPIPENVRKFWDSWSIRTFVILSLSLQIFLVLFASFRKKTGNTGVYSLIWSAYLLADWVPTFTAGLILNTLSNNTGDFGTSSIDHGLTNDLLALWAASLLRHLGGTFTITAFSLEDNELWLRHFIGLIVQFTTALYVFLCTLPNKKLLVPTIFALIGGITSYAQRVRSMYLATLDKYREDIVRHPYNPDEEYKELGLDKLFKEARREPLDQSDVCQVAYHYFQIFKGLIVNVEYMPTDKKESIKSFRNRITSQDTLQVILRELSYMYEVLYTNHLALTTFLGGLCSNISLVSGAVVLGKFVRAGKQDFHHVDIRISYALFIVPIVLDALVSYGDSLRPLSPYPLTSRGIADQFLHMIKSFSNDVLDLLFCGIFHKRKLKMLTVQIEPGIEHEVHGTFILWREWSECICAHNLISYCLKECPRTISKPNGPCRVHMSKILHLPLLAVMKILLFVRPVLDMLGLKDILDKAIYVSRCPFDKQLWDFLFASLGDMSSKMENGDVKLVSEARGGWALQSDGEPSCDRRKLLACINGVEYDESLLLWHIATELCYNTEEDQRAKKMGSHARVFSKIMSDYVLYLMVFQPSMMSTISGMFLKNYEDACEQTYAALREIRRGGGDRKLKDACTKILDSKVEFKTAKDGSKPLLFRACTLAEELKQLQEGERWSIMARVWVEMLTYAAAHCRGDIHARSLSRGGELLSMIWLLMAHFGLIGNQRDGAIVIEQEEEQSCV